MKRNAEFVERQFKELGVRLNPNSRIAKQIEAYLDRKGIFPQIIEPNHPLFETAVEAHRDVIQVAFALNQLRNLAPSNEIVTRLRRLVEDNVLPQDSPEHSPGRDAQLELFVAALCAKAGLSPIFDEQPDLKCGTSKGTLGIAIKRIKAPPRNFVSRLKKTAKSATEQIERSGMPGVIVADISQSLNPVNKRVPLNISNEQLDNIWHIDNERFRKRLEPKLRDWTKGKPVRGIICLNHILRNDRQQGWFLQLWVTSISLCRYNQRREGEFQEFNERFCHAVLNPGAVLPSQNFVSSWLKNPPVETYMPHVLVKVAPGKTEAQKQPLADQITASLIATFDSKEDAISIAIEEVEPSEWRTQVYQPDILEKPNTLYKKPGYTM